MSLTPAEYQKRYRERYPAKVAACKAASYRANAAYYKEKNKAWAKNNREACRDIQRLYRARRDPSMAKADYLRSKERVKKWVSANKERAKAIHKAWRGRNPGKQMAVVRRYQAKKLNATTKWANHVFIEEAYRLAELRTKLWCSWLPLAR